MDRPHAVMFDKKVLKSSNTYSRFRHLFMVPVVHAEGSAIPDAEVCIAPPKVLSDEEVNAYIDNEGGVKRVKNLFERDAIGRLTPDMKLMLFTTGQATLVTFLAGCWIGSKQAGEYYVYRHQAAKYETRFQALRSYYDAVLVGSAAHGFRYAVKIGSFTALFIPEKLNRIPVRRLTSQSIATYRNKTSALEYTVGGAVTGGVLRSYLGIRGLLAGGVLGGLLGLTGGLILWGVMSYSNERQQDRYFRYIQGIMLEKKRLLTIQEMSAQRAAETLAKSETL